MILFLSAETCPSAFGPFHTLEYLQNNGNISKSWAIYGTLQQCYVESVVTHSVHSVHRHIYLLYNTPIALHSTPIAPSLLS